MNDTEKRASAQVELKPCSHCGSEGLLLDHGAHSPLYAVYCLGDCDIKWDRYANKADAIAAWNARA